MKLSEWARSQGITYQTAFFWFKRGQLPVPAYQTATGTILVNVPPSSEGKTTAYVRVSSGLNGCRSNLMNDLGDDMIAVLTSFSARLYGKRSAKNRAKRVLDCSRESESQ
ncbi:MAG: hypothetical protein ABR903_03810 [Thermodesulfovibrionales bacterium]|jgi:predicted site-specific integrase-resolvase